MSHRCSFNLEYFGISHEVGSSFQPSSSVAPRVFRMAGSIGDVVFVLDVKHHLESTVSEHCQTWICRDANLTPKTFSFVKHIHAMCHDWRTRHERVRVHDVQCSWLFELRVRDPLLRELLLHMVHPIIRWIWGHRLQIVSNGRRLSHGFS